MKKHKILDFGKIAIFSVRLKDRMSGIYISWGSTAGRYLASKAVDRSFIVFGMFETYILFLLNFRYVANHSSYVVDFIMLSI